MSKFSKSIEKWSEKSKTFLIVALLIYAAFSTPFVLGLVQPPTKEIVRVYEPQVGCPPPEPESELSKSKPAKPETVRARTKIQRL